MSDKLARRPFACWDPFIVRVDIALLRTFLLRLGTAKMPALQELHVGGQGDRLRVRLCLRLAGLPFTAQMELEELRMRGGLLGFRLLTLRGPLGLPAPSILLSQLFRRLPVDVRWDATERIVLVDLRSRLPAGLELTIENVTVEGNSLAIHLGAGSLHPPLPELESEAEEPPAGV